jgi:catechol 2,3-dioxygenase-like lactoylglutathione lyase family enzyme
MNPDGEPGIRRATIGARPGAHHLAAERRITMPISTGFDHVATVTADLDRIVRFYQTVFDAVVTFEMAARADHPRMVILDLGGGSALNLTEQPADTIVGNRTTPGGRGPIDHYGIAVESRANLEMIRDRLIAAGADIGDIHQLGDVWSLFFRDPDGMELEVCAPT